MLRRAQGGLAFALALALSLGARTALADPSTLDSARTAYWSLDYEKALSLAESVLATTGLAHADFVEATRIRAMSLAARGASVPAREAFEALLECAPEFELDPKLGPRFRAPYAEARAYWATQTSPAAVDVAYRAEDGTLRVDAKDPRGALRAVVVAYRRGAGEPFSSARGTTTAGASIAIAPNADRVEYYAQALNGLDQVVIQIGSGPGDPRTLVIPARQALVVPPAEAPAAPAPAAHGGPSLFASPWLWTGVGVVATGIVAGYFAFRGGGAATEIVAQPQIRCGAAGAVCP